MMLLQTFLTYRRNELGLMAASECQRGTVDAGLRAAHPLNLDPIKMALRMA